MSNEIAKREQTVFGRYGEAANTRHFTGTLLRFSKGDFVAGADDDEIPVGSRFAAAMDSLLVGWVRWADNAPTEHRMGLVVEAFQPEPRSELGDTDKELWGRDANGEPRDPWQFTNYLPLAAEENDEIYTFTTSSRGGLDAIGKLCVEFDKFSRKQPDKDPIVALDVGSYLHRNRALGRLKYPIFKIVGATNKLQIG